jgi:hypothetical protein
MAISSSELGWRGLPRAVACWVQNRFPLPPPAAVNGFCAVGSTTAVLCEMAVLPSWPVMPLVGVSGVFAAITALLSASISERSRAFSSCSATCLRAPSLMCPTSTLLIASQNVTQSVCFSGIFSLTTFGSVSLTCQMLLVPVAMPGLVHVEQR